MPAVVAVDALFLAIVTGKQIYKNLAINRESALRIYCSTRTSALRDHPLEIRTQRSRPLSCTPPKYGSDGKK